MKSDQEKYDYLKKHFGFDFPQREHSFTLNCDFCRCEMPGIVTISKNNKAYKFSIFGASLNPDVQDIKVLCTKCRKNLTLYGRIQRWLKSINKTEKELPDCSNLQEQLFPP